MMKAKAFALVCAGGGNLRFGGLHMKKWLSVILSIVMLCTVLGGGASFACAATAATSGSCGDNIKYNIDTGTGVLTLTGSGATNNYSNMNINFGSSVKRCPWYNSRDSIKRVVISEGVTVLGNYLFFEMTSVQTGDFAFHHYGGEPLCLCRVYGTVHRQFTGYQNH